jgi:hypothetical protein
MGAGGAVIIGHCAFTLAARNTSREATTGRRIVETLFMVNKLDDGKRERQYPEECRWLFINFFDSKKMIFVTSCVSFARVNAR